MKASVSDAGCLIDGHWGQYATARMIVVATDYGYSDAEVIDIATRHLAAMGPSTAPAIADDEYAALAELSDEAEAWLNENAAPEGYEFGWYDGEFFFQSVDWFNGL